jgi:hypothetical protein
MRIARLIATPDSESAHKWDIEAVVERDNFDTHIARVEWYFGARSDTPVHTGKSTVIKDYTFKGDSKLVRVVVVDTKGTRYTGEILVSAAAEKQEAKQPEKKDEKKGPESLVSEKQSKQQPAKPATEPPVANLSVDAKTMPEPKKPFYKPESKDLQEKSTPDGSDTKVVTPEAPKSVSPKK